MHIEVTYRTGAQAADQWESEPDLRAEIKMKIAEAMGRILRTHDLIEWRTARNAKGDFIVRGFVNAELGDTSYVGYKLDLNPEK